MMTAEAFFSCLDDVRASARAAGRFAVAEALDDALFMAVSAFHDDESGEADTSGASASLSA